MVLLKTITPPPNLPPSGKGYFILEVLAVAKVEYEAEIGSG